MNQVFKRIDRRSLVQNAAEQLKQSILSGKLPPGTRLLEVDISEQLGISRGTLREALRILENDKLIESTTGHGSYVRSFSERDIRELYSLRSLLEQEAIRLATLQVTPQQLERLRQCLERIFVSAKKGDLAQVVSSDFDFHFEIWKIADHLRLLQTLEELSLQIKIYLAVQTKLYEDLASGIADHQAIFTAIVDRDSERAAELMREHLESASRTVLDYSQEMQSNTGG